VDCVRGAPYPALRKEPAAEVIAATRALTRLNAIKNPDISADIEDALARTWVALGLQVDAGAAREAARCVAAKNLVLTDVKALCAVIKRTWQPHWRKVPTPKQLDLMIKAAGIVPRATQIKLLDGYLKRWTLAQKTLRGGTAFETVQKTGVLAAVPSKAPLYPRI
jgi:hypothetical protein